MERVVNDAAGKRVRVETKRLDDRDQPTVWLVNLWNNYESMNGRETRAVCDDWASVQDWIGQHLELRPRRAQLLNRGDDQYWALDGGGVAAGFDRLRVVERPLRGAD